MAFCANCGTQVRDNTKFCPSCGGTIGTAPAQFQQPQSPQQPPPLQQQEPIYQQPQQQYQQSPQYQQQQPAPANDAAANKTMAILAYILFFIPLATGDYKKSPFVKYHVNQGTILFGIGVAYGILSAILSAVIRTPHNYYYATIYHTPGWLIAILWIVSLGIFALCIYGIYNAATGKTKPLPLIGDKIKIFK